MKMTGIVCVSALLSLMVPASLAQQSLLLVVQKGDKSLGIYDPSTDTIVTQIPVGGNTGHEVTASPDGKMAYVPIYGDSGVGQPGSDGSSMAVIDLAAQKVTGTVDFGHRVRPHQPVFGPKDGLLYVTTELDQSVSIIDPKTLKIVGAIPTTQAESHMLAISHDGKLGYTANVGPGTVSVLDMDARKMLKVITISGKTQRISISMDDRYVFTADQTKPQLAVIETATGLVKKWINLEGLGYGSAPSPDGKLLLVAIPSKHAVAVIDLKSLKVIKSVGVASDPQEVVISADGHTAWVSCESANEVLGIDMAGWNITDAIQTGKTPDGLAWAQPK
jgi:DNA-binding beta-propeller fold protein YncE